MSAKLFGEVMSKAGATAWAAKRAADEDWLDVQTAKGSLHRVNVVSFGLTRAYSGPGTEYPDRLYLLPHLRYSLKRAIQVWVDPPEVGTMNLMGESGAILPWVTATSRKRVGRTARWVLGLRNAVVVERLWRDQGGLRYKIACESITEMVPLVPDPAPAGPKLW